MEGVALDQGPVQGPVQGPALPPPVEVPNPRALDMANLTQQVQALNSELATTQNQLLVAQNKKYKPCQPPKLSGNGKDRWTIPSWLFTVNTYLEATGVTDHHTAIRTAATYLEGNTTEAWREKSLEAQAVGLACPFASWNDFAAWLLSEFLPLEVRKKARRELHNCWQRTGETTMDYVFRFRALKAKWTRRRCRTQS